MARYVGIDVGATQIKVAVIRGNARRWAIETLVAIDRPPPEGVTIGGVVAPTQTLEDVLREAAREPAAGGDPLSVGFDGARTFVRTLEVPANVRRRLAEVLPFELEAQLPFDIDEAVYDFRARSGVPANQPQPVLVAAARIEDVRERIDLLETALAREPDHVAPGAFPLADLAAVLAETRLPGLRAIVDLGHDQSEIVILDGTEPVFARTLSNGVMGMPSTAAALAREIRSTFASYRAAGGTPPDAVLVTGGGALVPDLPRWLASQLQMNVDVLQLHGIEGLPGRVDGHRFSRAIGIALSASPRRRGLDLRRGPLAFERGWGWIQEKVPMLAGVGAALLVTWLFATWARARNANADRAVLDRVLTQTAKEVFGEGTADPDRVDELLSKGGASSAEEDPLPRADAMDVMVQLSELIPTASMKHDIEKLEVSKLSQGGFKVILQGIAPNGADVATIESQLRTYRCFVNPTVTKKTKAISDDRQKYTLETDLRCPEEGGGATKPKGGAPSASGSK